jgi:hypothetical protein
MRLAFFRSPNYVAGVSGWTINQDGSVEFNNGVFRGSLTDSGMFVYNGVGAAGNPPIFSITKPGETVDPFGNAVVADAVTTYNAFGAVINCLSMLKAAFFQYFDNGSAVQGGLILSIASNSGTDPVGAAAYPAGLFGIDPVFGDSMSVVGANIGLSQVAYTRAADVLAHTASGVTTNPYLLVDAPEQTAAGHIQMLLQGFSPDGSSSPPQLLIGTVSGSAVLTPTSSAGMEVQGGSGLPVLQLQASAATVQAISAKVAADTNNRIQIRADGLINWGSGAAPADSSMSRGGANLLNVSTADLAVHTAGNGLRVAEGSNAKQGIATLVGGTKVVADTAVTANSRIFLCCQTPGGTPGFLRVSARTPGTSFTILSSSGTDTSVVAYEIFEPG